MSSTSTGTSYKIVNPVKSFSYQLILMEVLATNQSIPIEVLLWCLEQ